MEIVFGAKISMQPTARNSAFPSSTFMPPHPPFRRPNRSKGPNWTESLPFRFILLLLILRLLVVLLYPPPPPQYSLNMQSGVWHNRESNICLWLAKRYPISPAWNSWGGGGRDGEVRFLDLQLWTWRANRWAIDTCYWCSKTKVW